MSFSAFLAASSSSSTGTAQPGVLGNPRDTAFSSAAAAPSSSTSAAAAAQQSRGKSCPLRLVEKSAFLESSRKKNDKSMNKSSGLAPAACAVAAPDDQVHIPRTESANNAPASTFAVPDEQHDIPPHFRCPISKEIMFDPVTAADGHSYQRQHLQRWFLSGGQHSPVNAAVPLISSQFMPNWWLKAVIDRFFLTRYGLDPAVVTSPGEAAHICGKKMLEVQQEFSQEREKTKAEVETLQKQLHRAQNDLTRREIKESKKLQTTNTSSASVVEETRNEDLQKQCRELLANVAKLQQDNAKLRREQLGKWRTEVVTDLSNHLPHNFFSGDEFKGLTESQQQLKLIKNLVQENEKLRSDGKVESARLRRNYEEEVARAKRADQMEIARLEGRLAVERTENQQEIERRRKERQDEEKRVANLVAEMSKRDERVKNLERENLKLTTAAIKKAEKAAVATASSSGSRISAQHGDSSHDQQAEDLFPILEDFKCPIMHEVMRDPVTTADGHTYERSAIAGWFRNGGQTSPITGTKLQHQQLHPNYALRKAILAFLTDRAIAVEAAQKAFLTRDSYKESTRFLAQQARAAEAERKDHGAHARENDAPRTENEGDEVKDVVAARHDGTDAKFEIKQEEHHMSCAAEQVPSVLSKENKSATRSSAASSGTSVVTSSTTTDFHQVLFRLFAEQDKNIVPVELLHSKVREETTITSFQLDRLLVAVQAEGKILVENGFVHLDRERSSGFGTRKDRVKLAGGSSCHVCSARLGLKLESALQSDAKASSSGSSSSSSAGTSKQAQTSNKRPRKEAGEEEDLSCWRAAKRIFLEQPPGGTASGEGAVEIENPKASTSSEEETAQAGPRGANDTGSDDNEDEIVIHDLIARESSDSEDRAGVDFDEDEHERSDDSWSSAQWAIGNFPDAGRPPRGWFRDDEEDESLEDRIRHERFALY
ncbi:unnamed protein product [Amoebophrya sp. A120]|nr:unnamed protein product [Amoebophrya sp. A120]|eukprot:GSA120T00009265001.1